MTLIEELKIFVRNILHWVYAFVGSSFFFFFFGPEETVVFGKRCFLPVFTQQSFSSLFFNKITDDLLPDGVQLVVTNPMSAFLSQILFSILLGFLLTLPYFLYKIILYLSPALFPREKRVVLWTLFPFFLLFISGSAFAYYYIVPATFSVFYPYATAIGAVTFFSLDEFTYYVFSLMISVGVMFLLPLFMIILSVIGIIKPEFWKKKWRHATLFFLIVSAIITPDGTGITMVMLFVPLAALYFAGYYFAEKLGRVYN